MFLKLLVFYFLCCYNSAFSFGAFEKDSRGSKKRTKKEIFEIKKSKKSKIKHPKKEMMLDFDEDLSVDLNDEYYFNKIRKKDIRKKIKKTRDLSVQAAYNHQFSIQHEMNQKIVDLIHSHKHLQKESDFRKIFYQSQLEILKHQVHQEHEKAKQKAQSLPREKKWIAYKDLNEKHKEIIAFFSSHQEELSFNSQNVLNKAKVKILQFEISQLSSSVEKQNQTEIWEQIKHKNQEILKLDPANKKAQAGLLIDEIRVCHQNDDFSNKNEIMERLILISDD